MSTICVRCGRSDAAYLDSGSRMFWSKPCAHPVCSTCMMQMFGTTPMGGRVAATNPSGGASAAAGSVGGRAHSHAHAGRSHAVNRCPAQGCTRTLTLADYSSVSPDEDEYRRECEIRKRLSRIFNKSLSDFGGDTGAYNAYLERVEGYVARLCAGVGVEETNREIDAYAAENASSIAFNAAAAEAAQRETAEKIAAEAVARKERAAAALAHENAVKRGLERVRRTLVDVFLGERKVSDAERDALKQQLRQLKEQKLHEADLRARAAAAAAAGPRVIPCATVFPPRRIAEPLVARNPASLSAAERLIIAAPAVMPPDLLQRHKRAAGWSDRDAHAWLVDELDAEYALWS